MHPETWLPLTEYALRSGMSISTLRRKIKSDAIQYRLEEGRYLIKWDELMDSVPAYSSQDFIAPPPLPASISTKEKEEILIQIRKAAEENSLKWRMLEARVAGVAKKLDMFTEQVAEVKMLIKIFEEKLDQRL